ncbi:MAG: hypothetical protein ABII00_19035 [Elusimicrobiota bacterium]
MKRLLATVVGAILFFPPMANAEMFSNLKFSGSLDLQGNSARNTQDFMTGADGPVPANNNDRVSDMITRTMVHADWDLLDDVHAKVTVRKNDRTWGPAAAGQAGAANTAANPSGSQVIGAAGVMAAIYVDQAYFTIDKVFGAVDMTLGRQFYGEPGDHIIYWGPRDDYGLTTTAIDAFVADVGNDFVTFSGIAGKMIGSGQLTTAADRDIRGFDVGMKGMPLKFNAYTYNRVQKSATTIGLGSAVGGANDNLWVYSIKLRGDGGGGWFNFDAAMNGGANRLVAPGGIATTGSYSGKMFAVDFGFNMDVPDVGGFTPWANFGWGSGNSNALEGENDGFTAIASDFRPGIMNRRFDGQLVGLTEANGNAINTASLNNRVVWGFGTKVTPAAADQLTMGVSFWDFHFQRNTLNNAAFASNQGNKHIGYEYGLTADWNHSENVKIGVGYARFHPGGYIREFNARGASAQGHNPAVLTYADFSVKF